MVEVLSLWGAHLKKITLMKIMILHLARETFHLSFLNSYYVIKTNFSSLKAIVNLFSYEKKGSYFYMEILFTLSNIRKIISF